MSNFLNPDYTLNIPLYAALSPFYISSMFITSYFASFLNISSAISHVILWHGPTLLKQTKAAFSKKKFRNLGGIHDDAMSKYNEIPAWYYASWLFLFSALLVMVTSLTPFSLSISSTLLSLLLGITLSLPIGIISAVSGSRIGLNVLMELVGGWLMPGDMVGVMAFKSIGFNVLIQCLHMVVDLKMARYLKIDPASVVAVQLIGTVVGGVCSTSTVFWVLRTFKDELAQPAGVWAATGYKTFAVAGTIFGSIGPSRFFSGNYAYLYWGFLLGFLLPTIPWIINRWIYRSSNWEHLNVPLLTMGIHTGGNQASALTPFLLAFLFNRVIYTRHREWWNKYLFVTACGLSSGTAISILVVIFWRSVGSDGRIYSVLSSRSNLDYYCRGASWTERA